MLRCIFSSVLLSVEPLCVCLHFVCLVVDCFVVMLSDLLCCVLFFFKQKTAYEMRISDWSSDVCSSDLPLDSSKQSTSQRSTKQSRVQPPAALQDRGYNLRFHS